MKSSDFPDLALMREGIQYQFEISLRKFKVMVRPLTNLEIIKATAAAAEDYQKLKENEQSTISLSLLNAMHQLERASSNDVGEKGRLNTMLLQQMNPEEINHLWKQYVFVCDRVNPAFEKMPASRLANIAEELKKNSSPQSMLIDLSISELIEVCTHLLEPQAT